MYGHTTFCLFTYQLQSILTILTFWILWIMLLWTLMYKSSCSHIFSFLVVAYLGLEWLGHVGTLCLTLWETAGLFFHRAWTILQPRGQGIIIPVSLHPAQHLLSFVFLFPCLWPHFYFSKHFLSYILFLSFIFISCNFSLIIAISKNVRNLNVSLLWSIHGGLFSSVFDDAFQ